MGAVVNLIVENGLEQKFFVDFGNWIVVIDKRDGLDHLLGLKGKGLVLRK